MTTIYSEKIDDFISQLENEMREINLDIRKLETQRKVYQKILDDLREFGLGMTNKRFYLDYRAVDDIEIIDFVEDRAYPICIDDIDKNDLVDITNLMNQLEKENEMLKQEIEDNISSFKENNRKRLELENENEQLKQELKMIYEISTANKVRNIIEEIYDDLLYETSEKSDYERRVVLKCLDKIDDFRDDLE